MKTKPFFFATVSIIFLGFFTSATAQKINFWVGGTPGQATNWNCPKNWSTYRVPDAFQTVVIPDIESNSGFYPVINENGAEVDALILESGATLTITKKGSLKVEMTLEQIGEVNLEEAGGIIVPAVFYAGETKLETGAGGELVASK